jgi:hypothetical protein
MQVLTIALGALAGWKLIRTGSANGPGESFPGLPGRFQSVISLTLFAFCLLVLPFLAAGHRDGWLPLFDSFYRSGSLVFGGGHVVLPLLQAEVVPKVDDCLFRFKRAKADLFVVQIAGLLNHREGTRKRRRNHEWTLMDTNKGILFVACPS